MVVTRRSEKETLFIAYSSNVAVLPSTSHHASSFICKTTCSLIYSNFVVKNGAENFTLGKRGAYALDRFFLELIFSSLM